jgi:hypothetical protein
VFAALPQNIAELGIPTYSTVVEYISLQWPKDASGGLRAEVSLPEMLNLLKLVLSAVLSITADQLPRKLIKDVFHAAVHGADGKPPFLALARKVDTKSFFSLIAA